MPTSMTLSATGMPSPGPGDVAREQDTATPYKALMAAATMQLKWLRKVEQIVLKYGGKTSKELDPSLDQQPEQTEVAPVLVKQAGESDQGESPLNQKKTVRLVYKVYRSRCDPEPVAAHLVTLYAQLFEACWKGETKTVERLCLPPRSGKRDRNATYIQVTAEVSPADTNFGVISKPIQCNVKRYLISNHFVVLITGYSTLAIAILAKRWDTAKAIISIAKAQYHKNEEDPQRFPPFENSDDSEEYDSDMSADDYDEPVSKPQMIDLANRLSILKTSVGPEKLFGGYPDYRADEKVVRVGTPLSHALQNGDINSLKQISALGQMCDPPITLDSQSVSSAILSDEPAVLDFIIRRFGFGIDIQHDEEEHETGHDEHGRVSGKKTSKTYLGLNVGGRKRKDLVAKGDPNAPPVKLRTQIPLIWRAAGQNALKVLAWLVTSGPLDAYKAYMKGSSDETALAMKSIPNFEQKFPSLIGATVTDVGENVMLAHLSRGSAKLETIKFLFSLFPDLQTVFVRKAVEGLRLTSLHYVCAANLGTEIFDFFLGKTGADFVVTDRDYKG